MSLKIKGDVISSNTISGNLSTTTSLSAPIMIAFDITNKCNFKCLHCFNHSGEDVHSDELCNEEKIMVAKEVVKLKPYVVCICGGETTCCDVLYEILEILTPSVPTVNMVSNGYLITEQVAKKLKNLGISSVQISVDGINAEQHDTFRGHYGAFEHAIAAIKNLKKVDIPVMTSLVPNKLNYIDAYEYFKMCRDLGVAQARSMPYLPMGRGDSIGKKLLLTKEEEYKFCQLLMKAKTDFKTINIEWGDPIDHMYRLPENASLGVETYSMDIRSNGDIGISAYFPIVVGNIKRHSLQEYWNAGYNKIWQNSKVLKTIREIENVNDFSKIASLTPINIDLVEGDSYEI